MVFSNNTFDNFLTGCELSVNYLDDTCGPFEKNAVYFENNFVKIDKGSGLNAATFLFAVGIGYKSTLQFDLPLVITNNVFSDSPVVNDVILINVDESLMHDIIIDNNTF